jgi:hypothetical protein
MPKPMISFSGVSMYHAFVGDVNGFDTDTIALFRNAGSIPEGAISGACSKFSLQWMKL